MSLIPTRVHGVLDYAVGLLLIAAPWLFDFSDVRSATLIAVIIGAGVIAYSVLTDYELGLVRVIPMQIHLFIDIIGGLVLVASPWVLDFADAVWIPHVAVGLIAIGSGLLTARRPGRTRMF